MRALSAHLDREREDTLPVLSVAERAEFRAHGSVGAVGNPLALLRDMSAAHATRFPLATMLIRAWSYGGRTVRYAAWEIRRRAVLGIPPAVEVLGAPSPTPKVGAPAPGGGGMRRT